MHRFLRLLVAASFLLSMAHAQQRPRALPADPGRYVEEPTQNMTEDGRIVAPARPRGTMDEDGLRKVLDGLPPGSRHQHAMVAMRDGVRLATDWFLPPEGAGPWPVVLLRTQYSRWDGRGKNKMKDTPCVIVLQNVRGSHGSEGRGTYDPKDFRVDVNDGYDTIAWLAAQPWSNGKVGMWGPSGHGIAAINALWSLSPNLVAVDVNVTMDNAYLYIALHNGARRGLYSWLGQRGLKTRSGEWPRPTVVPYDPETYFGFLREVAPKVTGYYRNDTGWFDVFSESALDHFAVLAPYGRAFVRIGASGHGRIYGDAVFTPRNRMPPEALALSRASELEQCLTKGPPTGGKSGLVYFLMGDGKDPAAPGNVWMTSDRWPVEHTPTAYYLRADGRLTSDAPSEPDARLTYVYDPRDPAPMLGGHHQVSDARRPNIGPMDQRPNAERKDILRFRTVPLDEPVGVTGKIWVDLHVSSDCPDTMFTAKLVDIYPDGYEAHIREGAILARYHGGYTQPAPLQPGRVVRLSFDLWSTALVFNKGHRIALYVSSSSDPAYEVHPNTYEPVPSMEQARVARNTVHLSATQPSRLILPVVKPETYLRVGATPRAAP